MYLKVSSKGLRFLSIWVILFAWSFQPAVEYFQTLQHLITDLKPVQSLSIEIEVDHGKTCHHHPEGCPKDCLCPDKHMQNESSASPDLALGRLFEPSLVQCTETGLGDTTSASTGIYLPTLPCAPKLASFPSGACILHCFLHPQAPALDPALKIPIA